MSNKRKFILNSLMSKDYCIKYIDRMDINSGLEVVIQKERKHQSDDQREGFHYLLKILANELGYEPEELKEVIKIKTFGFEVKVIMGEEVRILKSTTKYTREEYSMLIETLYRIAAEMGIILPELKK